jgi:hypothetical protein
MCKNPKIISRKIYQIIGAMSMKKSGEVGARMRREHSRKAGQQIWAARNETTNESYWTPVRLMQS